jgi:hypothetical protein
MLRRFVAVHVWPYDDILVFTQFRSCVHIYVPECVHWFSPMFLSKETSHAFSFWMNLLVYIQDHFLPAHICIIHALAHTKHEQIYVQQCPTHLHVCKFVRWILREAGRGGQVRILQKSDCPKNPNVCLSPLRACQDRNTALMLSTRNGDVDVMRLLLESKADVKAANKVRRCSGWAQCMCGIELVRAESARSVPLE